MTSLVIGCYVAQAIAHQLRFHSWNRISKLIFFLVQVSSVCTKTDFISYIYRSLGTERKRTWSILTDSVLRILHPLFLKKADLGPEVVRSFSKWNANFSLISVGSWNHFKKSNQRKKFNRHIMDWGTRGRSVEWVLLKNGIVRTVELSWDGLNAV